MDKELENQLFAYVTTRMLSHKLGYDFGIAGGLKNAGDSRVNKKGFYFMNLNYGKRSIRRIKSSGWTSRFFT
jgi:hypothetical protein